MLEQLLLHIFQNSKLILAHSSKNSLPNNHSINHAMMMEKNSNVSKIVIGDKKRRLVAHLVLEKPIAHSINSTLNTTILMFENENPSSFLNAGFGSKARQGNEPHQLELPRPKQPKHSSCPK